MPGGRAIYRFRLIRSRAVIARSVGDEAIQEP